MWGRSLNVWGWDPGCWKLREERAGKGGKEGRGEGKVEGKGGCGAGARKWGGGGGIVLASPAPCPAPPPPALPHRLLVSAPWDGPQGDHRGELYKCPLEPPNGTCTKSNLGTGGGARGGSG